jgi:hypothetical protein
MLPWFFLLLAQVAIAQKPIPTFDQFVVRDSFSGQPAKPILRTPRDRLFRTMIRNGAAKGPNFAGHYTIVYWGCGTSCIQAVVVEAKGGRVQSLSFSALTYGSALRYVDGKNVVDDIDFEPLSFNLKSRLLIVRGCPEDKNCSAFYYEWTEPRFRLIRKFDATPISTDPP